MKFFLKNSLLRIGSIVIALGLVSFFNDVASEMIIPLLPAYISSLPGGGGFVIGLMEGVSESISSFLKLFSGWILDRKGYGKVMISTGYAIAVFARSAIGFASHAYEVLVLRILDRIGKGIRTSPRDALIASSSQKDAKGLAFGFHRAMDHAGALVGPSIAFILMSSFLLKPKYIIILSFVPGAISFIPLLFAMLHYNYKIAPGKTGNLDSEKTSRSAKISFWGYSKNFYFYLFVCSFFTIGNSSDLFLLLRASQSGVKQEYLAAIWVVFHLSKMIFSVPAGSLSDKIGRKKPILMGWTIYSVTYFIFPHIHATSSFFIIFIFYGLYFALTEGVEKAFVSDLVPEEKRGGAYGLYNFAVAVGSFPASLLMGVLYQWVGYVIAFSVGGCIALASAVALLFVKETGR